MKVLDLSGNQFQILPSTVYKLSALTELDVSSNKKLVKIEEQILILTNLKQLECDGCSSLEYPPYTVCKQGLSAIQKYFTDLITAKGKELTKVPIVIVGQVMSGKTSIVRSLQTGSRQLTFRQSTSVLDETTKVFQIEKLPLGNTQCRIIDFGGHEVYNFGYTLVHREQCVPMVVVNMEEFYTLSADKGYKEATRRLCFDWLSHLYLASPRLGSPILIMTHKDRLYEDEFTQCRDELLKTANFIKDELLEEDRLCSTTNLIDVEHLSTKDKPLFDSDEIYEFSNDLTERSNIEKLKNNLEVRCKKFSVEIPRLWEHVGNYIESQKEKPYLEVRELESNFAGEDLDIILKYMYNSGRFLWFENESSLSNYIFHNIPAVTEMITLLFHHSSEEQWKQRVANFTDFFYKKETIVKQRLESYIQEFTTTGVLDEILLMYLLQTGSKISSDIAVDLLKSLFIVYGPIKQQNKIIYMIPYFSEHFMKEWKTDGDIQLRLDVILGGLSLPWHVYQFLTVAFLNQSTSKSSLSTVHIARNGAAVHHGKSTTYLVHDYNNKTITLQVSTDIEHLGGSWKNLLQKVKNILSELLKTWKACHPEIRVYCSHCLFLREPSPTTDIGPSWFPSSWKTLGSVEVADVIPYTGIELVSCKRHEVSIAETKPSVPTPFRFPCKLAFSYFQL